MKWTKVSTQQKRALRHERHLAQDPYQVQDPAQPDWKVAPRVAERVWAKGEDVSSEAKWQRALAADSLPGAMLSILSFTHYKAQQSPASQGGSARQSNREAP